MKKSIVGFTSLLIGVVVWALPSSQTANVTVSWTPGFNTNYPNISYITGFMVYYGTTTNLATDVAVLAPAWYTNVNVAGLTRGATYYFTVTELGNSVESEPSNFVSYTVPNKPPKPGTVTTN